MHYIEQNIDTFLVADHLLKCFELVEVAENKAVYRQILMEVEYT